MARILSSSLPLAFLFLSQLAPAQEPLALEGHQDAVSAASYSPDGRLVVTGSFDRTLRIFNAEDGAALRTLSGHEGQVLSVAISHDGRRVISGSRDSSVKLWDLYIPTPIASFAGHEGPVGVVQVSGDGTWVATAGADKLVKIWQRSDGMLLHDLEGHEATVTCAAVNKDNSQLVTGDENGFIRFWDPKEGTLLGTLGAHTAAVTGIAYHPTSDVLLTSAADGTAKLWALPTVPPKSFAEQAEAITAVAIAKDGKLLITGTADEKVQVLTTDESAEARELAGQSGAVASLVLSSDAALLASGSETGIIKLWNVADGADRLSLLGHAGAVHDLSMSAEGDKIASAGEDGTLRIWRLPVAATELAGHTMPVSAVAASPDGKLLATGSADKSVRLWNAADGAAAQTLEGHAEAVHGVAFRADNMQLVTADAAGEIQLWNAADGASQGKLYGPASPVSGLAYFPDGKTLLSSTEEGTLSWWTLPTEPAKPLAGNTDAVSEVAVSADGKLVVTGGADASVRVFDATTAQPVRALEGQDGSVTALALSTELAASANGQGVIQFWNLADGADRLSIASGESAIADLAFQPQGKQIASAGADGTIRIWNLPTAVKSLPGSALAVHVAAFSADGTLVASAGMAGGRPTIIVRSTADGSVKATLLGHEGAISSLAFSADKTKLASGSADKTARVWNLADPKFPELVKFAGQPAAITALAFSADGKHVYSGAADNSVKQWQVADGMEVRALTGHTGAISGLAVAGTTLASASADKTVRLWNVADGSMVRSLTHEAAVTSVAISPDAKTIAAGGADNAIKLFNAADGTAVATLAGHAGPVSSVAFSSDGARVIGCSTDGVRIWSAAGLPLERFSAEAIKSVSFSSDDATLLAGDAKHTLQTITPSIVRVIEGHEGAVTGIAFSPDGATIFSGGADKTVRRFTVADGKQVGSHAGPTDAVTSLSLSADGKRLVAGSADMNVYTWPVAAPAAQPVAADGTFTHAAPVQAVSGGPDGTRIAAAGDDNLITVWSLASGKVLQRFPGHTMPVLDVALAADNQTLISGSADKTAQMLSLAATRVVAAAEGKVNGLSISADGTMAVTAGEDKKVTVWNTADGQPLHEIGTGEATPATVALRPDKSQLAIGLSDMTLQLRPLTAEGPGEPVTVTLPAAAAHISFHPATGKLAVTCADKQLRVYDATSATLLEQVATADAGADVAFLPGGDSVVAAVGNNAVLQPLSLLQLLAGHEGAVTGVAFTPDATAVISGGADKTVRMWNLADGTQTRTFAGAADTVTALELSADGKLLAAASADKNLLVWDVAAPPAANQPSAPIATVLQAAVMQSLSISDDATRIATSGDDGVVRVLDVATGRELERFVGHEGAVASVDFAADNKTLVSGGSDKLPRLWTVAATRVLVADESRVGDVAFLADGSAFVTSGAADMLVKFWNMAGETTKQLAGAKAALGALDLSTDGTTLAATDAEGIVYVWTVADGSVLQTIETSAVVNDLDFSPDGGKLAAAGADNHLRVYNPAEGTLLQEQVSTMPLLAARFAPEGRELVTGNGANSVDIWAYASPAALTSLAGHEGPVYSVAFSPDGKLAASAGADKTVRVWNLETGEQASQLTGHTGAVYSVRFDAAGEQIVTSGADGTARIWNAANGQPVKSFAPEVAEGETPPPLFDATLSANGQQIAAAGAGKEINVWTVANGQLAQTITGHEDAVYRIDFNTDGTKLVSIGHAGSIHSWNPANGQPIATAKLPSVTYSAALSPTAAKAIVVCADQKAYIVDVP